ncbi:DUF4352 domain-containing protein [Ornithinibacillus scapharcae]|uniref:DUF4352 domain-containing protein n=1 Tax=Ornithinibacillus scapharcae TaxID=1147159 RepID=UPI000225AA6C|nr:DUF4352 domain-containing protein [Ornithinibacillus scapharcae]
MSNEKKPFYKKFWFWLLVIIVVIIIATSGGDDEDGTADNTNDTNTETTEDKNEDTNDAVDEGTEEGNNDEAVEEDTGTKTAKIGEPATTGDVTFTVNGVEEATEIKSDNQFIENATTSGKFVIVDVNVKNGKSEAITINSSFFKIVTDDGVEYDPSTSVEVTMALGDAASEFFLEQINPNLDKTGKVVFEVAADVDLSKTVLRAQTGFFGTESIDILLAQ